MFPLFPKEKVCFLLLGRRRFENRKVKQKPGRKATLLPRFRLGVGEGIQKDVGFLGLPDFRLFPLRCLESGRSRTGSLQKRDGMEKYQTAIRKVLGFLCY